MKGFVLLEQMLLYARSAAFHGLRQKAMCLVMEEIIVSPAFLGKMYPSVLAHVKILSENVGTEEEADRALDGEKGLIQVAQAGFEIWIHRSYVGALHAALQHKWEREWGYEDSLVHTRVLVECLEKVRCQAVLYRMEGLTKELHGPGLQMAEPAEIKHRMAHLNVWTVAKVYSSSDIILFRPASGAGNGMEHYPVGNPASRDCGLVVTPINYMGTEYHVRLTPNIVRHADEVLISHPAAAEDLNKMRSVRQKRRSCALVMNRLEKVPAQRIGGFRIEVTVRAPTLSMAKMQIEGTPLLDIEFWTSWNDRIRVNPKVEVCLANKDSFMSNARWICTQATLLQPIGDDERGLATPAQKRATEDMMSAIGWQVDRVQGTRLSEETGWWTQKGE